MGVVKNISRLMGPAILPKVSYKKRIIDIYTRFYLKEDIQKNTILYESRDGKSLTDSPFAVFEQLLEKDINQTYTHIWVIANEADLEGIKKTYQSNQNVLFVIRNSDDYLKWLTKAEYLINNSTFQPFVTIKNEQTYINTWHGTPLKTMGFDIPGNPANAKNVVRNFYMADYLLSPNPHTTNMFINSYQLNDNFNGKIIEAGYPRIDQTFHTDKNEMIGTLKECGLTIDKSKKIILYTPTCKDANITMTDNSVAQIHQEMAVIRKRHSEYNVLIKVHPFLYEKAKQYQALQPFLVPDLLDTNKILSCVDILITDYSSIFFDFLVTNRPIVFYCWDDDLYDNERGKYIKYKDLPGPVTFSVEELSEAIERLPKNKETEEKKYQAFKKTYTPYDDGQVTSRIIDVIFNHKTIPTIKTIGASTTKKRLMIYPGGMRSNGITSSFLNLLQTIDYTKFSVVCFLDNIKTNDQIKNVSFIPKNVTMLFRFDDPNYTIKEKYQDLSMQLHGVKNLKEDNYPNEMYKREIRRLLGKQTYDVAIDFSGYSLHWSKMVLATTAQKHVCYLHSDMKLDQEREVNGRKIHYINLRGIFSVYNCYDKLVSVSSIINQINQEKLSTYADKNKFVYATNTIDPQKILGKTKEEATNKIIKTTRLNRDGVLKEIDKIKQIWTTRPDTHLTSSFDRLFTSEKVLVLGSFRHNETGYYKITQDDLYIGWVKSTDIDLLPNKLIAEKKVSYFGKINTVPTDVVYSGPIGLETTIPVATAKHLRNIVVHVKKEAITQDGSSIELVIKGQKIGYLPKNKVTYSKKLNWTEDKPVPTKKRVIRSVAKTMDRLTKKEQLKKIKNKPQNRKLIEKYYRNVNESSLIGYSAQNSQDEEINLLKPTYIYILSLLETSDGEYFYEIKNEQNEIYWIKQEDMDFAPLEKEEVVHSKNKNEIIELKNNKINVYMSLDDCIKNNVKQKTIEKELHVTKRVTTSLNRVFLEVEWDNQSIWIEEKETDIKFLRGVFNAAGHFFPFPDKKKTAIVTTGRLSQEKNQQVLIEAFALFQEKHPDSILYIIGTGPEKENLKNIINQLNLTELVILMDQVYHPFVFMKECDIFALTSLYEGQSLVLIEALTLGMTCLSTDIPACRDVLKNGEYGLLTKTNDARGICRGLEQLVENPPEFKVFDPYSYNKEALNLFYDLLT